MTNMDKIMGEYNRMANFIKRMTVQHYVDKAMAEEWQREAKEIFKQMQSS